MQIRVSALVLLVALSFSFLLLPQGAARADDGESLRLVQAALNKSDFDEAVKLLKPLVDSGNAEALYVMGRLILDGKGVKKNRTRAAEFFRLAAEKGDVSAMNSWGTALASGDGVPRNYREAARWFRKAADALGKAQPPQPWRGTLVSLAALVAAEGPHASHADALTALRRQVRGKPGAGGGAAGSARTEADALLEAAGASPRSSGPGTAFGLAAALKLLRHLYLARQRGSHKVWVLSLPVSFTDWPSAELAAASAAELRQKLAAPGERFSLEDRKHLSDCTQEAMRWCMKTLILLADAQNTERKAA